MNAHHAHAHTHTHTHTRTHTCTHTQETCPTLEEAISDSDVVYMTRVQKERFPSEKDYLKVDS